MSDQDDDSGGMRPSTWPDVAGCLVVCLFILGLVALCGWLGVIGDR